MWCGKCDKHLSQCVCEDLPERIKAIGASGAVVLHFCSGCGDYYARCKCQPPKPGLEQRLGDRIVGVVTPAARTLLEKELEVKISAFQVEKSPVGTVPRYERCGGCAPERACYNGSELCQKSV